MTITQQGLRHQSIADALSATPGVYNEDLAKLCERMTQAGTTLDEKMLAAFGGVGGGQTLPEALQDFALRNNADGWESLGAALWPRRTFNFRSGQLDPAITFTRASGGTYRARDGLLYTASTNEPRFHHSPQGIPLGLLIEQAAANIAVQSERFDHAKWTKGGDAIVLSNAGIAPDGNKTADRLTVSNGGPNHIVQEFGLKTGSITFSAFVKRESNSIVNLRIFEGNGVDAWADFDLSTGQVLNTGGTVDSTHTEPWINGWFRVGVTATVGSLGAIFLRIGGSIAQSTMGKDLLIWGAMYEDGNAPTSYVKSGDVAGSRAADLASITGASFSDWWNASEGTILIDLVEPQAGHSGRISFNDGTTSNRIVFDRTAAGDFAFFSVGVGSSDGDSRLTGQSAPGTPLRMVGVYKSDRLQLAANGQLAAADTALTFPTGINRLYLSNTQPLAGFQMNAPIGAISYWDTAVPEWQMFALSQTVPRPLDQIIAAPTREYDFTANPRLPAGMTFSRASTATYRGADGLLHTAAVDEPRFQHDALGRPLGYLPEQYSKNDFLHSEDFANSYWFKDHATIVSRAGLAPDDSKTANKLVENADAGQEHEFRRSMSWTSGEVYTASIFVKAAERTGLRILMVNGFAADTIALFNIAKGTVHQVGAGATSAEIENWGGGWYRCTITATATATASGPVAFELLDSAFNVNYAGDGVSGLLVWGAMVEQGTGSSYVKSVDTTGTREPDQLSVEGAEFSGWFNADQGTVLLDFIEPVAAHEGRVTMTDAAGQNRYIFRRAIFAQFQFYTSGGGVFDGSVTADGSVPGSRAKAVMSYETNRLSISAKGAQGTVDTSYTKPSGVDRLHFYGIATNQMNAPIARFAYWNTALPDWQKQYLSRV